MIDYQRGNILRDASQAIVIPVNIKGVAGAGLAKQWATSDPIAFQMYKTLCQTDRMELGQVTFMEREEKIWILFPTKDDWRRPSQLRWILSGLSDLRTQIKEWELNSVAIPALGCGLGSLEWKQVRPLMEKSLSPLVGVAISIYPPQPY